MFGDITNADRAAWADEALSAFTALCYASEETEDKQTRIKDLITDLLHLARRECGIEDAAHFAALAAQMHDMEFAEDAEE